VTSTATATHPLHIATKEHASMTDVVLRFGPSGPINDRTFVSLALSPSEPDGASIRPRPAETTPISGLLGNPPGLVPKDA